MVGANDFTEKLLRRAPPAGSIHRPGRHEDLCRPTFFLTGQRFRLNHDIGAVCDSKLFDREQVPFIRSHCVGPSKCLNGSSSSNMAVSIPHSLDICTVFDQLMVLCFCMSCFKVWYPCCGLSYVETVPVVLFTLNTFNLWGSKTKGCLNVRSLKLASKGTNNKDIF